MEFRTDHEAELYNLLRQVLSNYIVVQRISYHQTLATSPLVLGACPRINAYSPLIPRQSYGLGV
jgi:hypothetical protein